MSIQVFDYTQIINQLCPDSIFSINENDYSTLSWSVNNTLNKPTESEIITKNNEMINIMAYDFLRIERNKLLEESDKYSLSDYPHVNETIRNQWLSYRTSLRNITSQTPIINLETGELTNIIWPIPPGT